MTLWHRAVVRNRRTFLDPAWRIPLLVALVTAVLPAAPSFGQRTSVAIHDVTVVDPATGVATPGRDVLVRGGRIHRVTTAQEQQPRAQSVVDGSGKFLIPGLLDMHVHLNLEVLDDPQPTLDLLLAHGVTGVRDMSSDCWAETEDGKLCLPAMRRIAREIRRGKRFGPRILAMTSPVVRGPWQSFRVPEGAPPFATPETPEAARELVRYVKARGADLIKIYNGVPAAVYAALTNEARRRNIEVSGHLPLGVGLVEASNLGHRTVEHARDLPVACSRYGAEYRQTMRRVIDGDMQADPPDAETRLRGVLESFDEALCDEVLATLARNGTYLVPTHGTRELDARAADPDYRDDPRWRFVAPRLRERWEKDLDDMAAVAPQLGELYQEFYDLGLRLTARAHAAGVRILAATDANDTMIFPGSGMHDELERLVQAGLSPLDALRAATVVSAEYLGRDDLGRVAQGQRADLVLLRRNPLEDISAVREIDGVVFAGRWIPRDILDAKLSALTEEP